MAMTSKESIQPMVNSSHIYFAICSEHHDDILEIFHTKDFLKVVLEHKNLCFNHLKPISPNVIFMPESKKIGALLPDFKIRHNHLSIILDEYVVILGLVTIKEIISDIKDKFDQEATKILKTNEYKFNIDALTQIEDFNNFFDVNIDDSKLEHLLEVNEEVTIRHFTFKVTAADKRHGRVLHVTINQDKKISVLSCFLF